MDCVAACCKVTCGGACGNHDLIQEVVGHNLVLSLARGIDPVRGLYRVLNYVKYSVRYACLVDRIGHYNLVLVKVFSPADNLLVQIGAWDQTIAIFVTYAERDFFERIVQKPGSAFP